MYSGWLFALENQLNYEVDVPIQNGGVKKLDQLVTSVKDEKIVSEADQVFMLWWKIKIKIFFKKCAMDDF